MSKTEQLCWSFIWIVHILVTFHQTLKFQKCPFNRRSTKKLNAKSVETNKNICVHLLTKLKNVKQYCRTVFSKSFSCKLPLSSGFWILKLAKEGATDPTYIQLFKINEQHTRKWCEIHSKITTKTSERSQILYQGDHFKNLFT